MLPIRILIPLLVVCGGASMSSLLAGDDAELDHFETKIRPALHSHCLACHNVEKKSGGLALDSREGWKIGGDSGPAIAPGQPAESLLLKTIQHAEVGLEMPAKEPKLDAQTITDFESWIASGAIDPRDVPEPVKVAESNWQKLYDERATWWSWQPLRPTSPQGSRGIDAWIDERLQVQGVTPSPEASPRTLVRRLSFQLRGLPPTYDECQEYVADPSTESWEKLVDKYLASDEFAEHWARHWMDTVRYAETHGSEDDAYLPFAYRYRDYMVRSFKQDIAVDRLIEEHVAGDLISPRWSTDGVNEALLGLAFWRFVEFNQTPVDVKKEEIVVIDSQIDAVGKTFQGITISCARCHDHKFDPISDEDYYALYGVLRSTRSGLRVIDDPAKFTQQHTKLGEIQSRFTKTWSDHWLSQRSNWGESWPAAVDWFQANVAREGKWGDIEKLLPEDKPLVRALARARFNSPRSEVRKLLTLLTTLPEDQFATEWHNWGVELRKTRECGDVQSERISNLLTLDAESWHQWRIDGAGMPSTLVDETAAWASHGKGESPFTHLLDLGYHSNQLSDRQAGILRSPDFVVDSDAISILCRGTNGARARLVMENFQGDSLLFETVNPTLNSDVPIWITMTIRPQWRGLRAHLEFLTRDAKPYIGVTKEPASLENSDGRSSFGILKIMKHTHGERLPELPALPDTLIAGRAKSKAEVLAQLIQSISDALSRLGNGEASSLDKRWLNVWIEAGLLRTNGFKNDALQSLIGQYREVENQIPIPRWAPAVYEDHLPVKQAWLPRGDHRSPGDELQRGYLKMLAGVSGEFPTESSGRLELAKAIVNPQNPLTARVYVNRVWNWLYGEGLVRSVDNFGRMGDVPSHPELLDELAQDFMQQGWSTKNLIRKMVLSQAWRRGTVPTSTALEKDADNRLWSHAFVRRIDAEAIRDSMLLLAGNLQRPDGGLGTLNYYRTVMEPNKQSPSGPLDGDGRRSIYLEVRRNFPNDFLLTFDFPRPASPVGKRNSTVVPTQSLTLLNDPFVLHESGLWGKRIFQAELEDNARIRTMYHELLGRDPTENEHVLAVKLVTTVREKEGDENAWKVFAHALFNLKEFIFLR